MLYVALTRATEKLVISFSLNEQSNKDKQYCFKNILLNQLPQINFEDNNSYLLKTKLTYIQKENEQYFENSKRLHTSNLRF